VRVVAATNVALEDAIQDGKFRPDLYHRLSPIQIKVPALRERLEDIGPLAAFFLQQHDPRRRFTAEAIEVLQRHAWPGNVRELRNMMERIVIMNPQVRIDVRHIPLNVPKKAAVARSIDRFASLAEVRETAEREYILKKLDETKGNVSRTAELLGLERSNLYRKMKALGIATKE